MRRHCQQCCWCQSRDHGWRRLYHLLRQLPHHNTYVHVYWIRDVLSYVYTGVEVEKSRNLVRERSHSLVRPQTSEMKLALLLSRGNWKLSTFLHMILLVTIVMQLRSFSSGGTTKFLTWTWTWLRLLSTLISTPVCTSHYTGCQCLKAYSSKITALT